MYNAFFGWKTLLYADKCEAILAGKFLPPVTLHIYPTNECNNKCKFCIMKDEQREHPDTMPENIFMRLIADADSMGVKGLHISGGGEPTLYKHLSAVSLFNGYRVLSTNGRELTLETARLFNRIRVSLNAGSPEVYSKVNGTSAGEWERVISNLGKLASKPRSYELGIGFVADMNNWTDIGRVCEIADSLELDFIHIRPAYYKRDTPEEIKMRQMALTIYNASAAAQNICRTPVFSISEKFDGFWSERKYKSCLASPLHAVCTASSEFVVCQDVFVRFGDLRRQKFQEIWGSNEHKQALMQIKIGDCPRCVMNRSNEIMEHVFINNEIKKELL